MQLLWLLVPLAAFTLSACTPPGLGEVVDLTTIATPDPLPPPAHTLPAPIPGPTPGAGMWRAWVPRDVAANGDVIDGHWIIISATPPPLETVEPSAPIPRAPKVHVQAKPKPTLATPAPSGVQPSLAPPGSLGQPQGVRAPTTPFAIPTLGGQ